LGQQLLVFRGRGGSGKTIRLLRLAKDLYDNGKRVLLLTFNKALVADIRRLLVLLGINNQGFDRGIHISTAHKYFIQMFSAWNMWQAPGEGQGFP
jgi:superfamily II DNA or RNA helicase